MAEVTWFDACCSLGRYVHMPENQPETAEEILAVMDHYGIHEALVMDTIARDASPPAGNARVLERVADHPRLHPAWAGLMSASRELPPPDELVARMRAEGVAALFLYYNHMDIRLDEWAIDDLMAELERVGCPVFLCPNSWRPAGQNEQTDWENVTRICRKFPDLPVVVTEHRIFFGQRTVYAALAACPNLRIEMSSMWRYGAIEFIAKEFGAERMVWGSQMPMREPGATIGQVARADIGEENLAKVAGGNLRELLAWNDNFASVADSVSFPEPIDELHRAAREGLDLSGENFYDSHGHIGWSSPFHVVHRRAPEIVADMDRHGMRKCIVFGLEGILGDETYCNDLVAEVVAQFPERFLGLTFVNMHHGEAKLREEMQRGLEMGLRGVKIINNYQGYPTEGPLVDVACEFCHEHGFFILNHDWGSPAQIERLCTTYPDACFLTGHSNASYGEVTRRVSNLFIGSCPMHGWKQTERFVEIYGADRIVFGSDLCDLPIGWGMFPIMFANISEEDKRKILGGNLERELASRSS